MRKYSWDTAWADLRRNYLKVHRKSQLLARIIFENACHTSTLPSFYNWHRIDRRQKGENHKFLSKSSMSLCFVNRTNFVTNSQYKTMTIIWHLIDKLQPISGKVFKNWIWLSRFAFTVQIFFAITYHIFNYQIELRQRWHLLKKS